MKDLRSTFLSDAPSIRSGVFWPSWKCRACIFEDLCLHLKLIVIRMFHVTLLSKIYLQMLTISNAALKYALFTGHHIFYPCILCISSQIYQSWLDKSTPYTAVRWIVTLGLSFIYMIRVYLLQVGKLGLLIRQFQIALVFYFLC